MYIFPWFVLGIMDKFIIIIVHDATPKKSIYYLINVSSYDQFIPI